ncbi:MAG TPA: hypothetical protein VN238_19110, partial [Solirubrobacteraceae bacterium]|nr:hypothetical protein [Solirubrobacteraceae bacterium]
MGSAQPTGGSEGSAPRRGRGRTLAWSAAGLASALALIGGSLAALDREVLSNGEWHPFAHDDGSRQRVELAPDAPRTALGGGRQQPTTTTGDGGPRRGFVFAAERGG